VSARLGAALLVAAVVLGGDGLWLHAKAVLAQALLARAWSAAEAGDARPRPWPWADTWPVARIEVPRLGVDEIVLAGASGRVLAFAPGHVDGTPLPGEPGNAILAGHRDTTFRFLERLAPGDEIRTELPGGREAVFTVDSTRVQDAADPWAFEAPDGATVLTLATCWPFDSPVPGGRLRYVVRATAGSSGAVLPKAGL
jgi:sortase A